MSDRKKLLSYPSSHLLLRRRRRHAPILKHLLLHRLIPTHSPQPLPPNNKPKRNRYHNETQTPQQRSRPLYTEIVKHLPGKQREAAADNGAEDRVGGEDGRGELEIRVDEVVEALQEDAEDAEADEEAGSRRCHPVDGGCVACPAEPGFVSQIRLSPKKGEGRGNTRITPP